MVFFPQKGNAYIHLPNDAVCVAIQSQESLFAECFLEILGAGDNGCGVSKATGNT